MDIKILRKARLLILIDILRTSTDENNYISTQEVIGLMAEHGLEIDRKTVYADIATIMELGYNVLKINCGINKYALITSEFDIAELKLLIDAVLSAKFLTAQKTDALVCKLAKLAGGQNAQLLKREIVLSEVDKHTNEHILYNIDAIHNAIIENKYIEFLYFDYDYKKNIVYRQGGAKYVVAPLALVFNDNNYYLVAYSAKHKKVVNFRVDKIKQANLIEDKKIEQNNCIAEIDLSKIKQAFGMYGGEEKEVILEVSHNLINAIIDKFGENININKNDDSFSIKVNIQVSPTFFGWCSIFGDELKIISPESLVNQYQSYLHDILKKYQINSNNKK